MRVGSGRKMVPDLQALGVLTCPQMTMLFSDEREGRNDSRKSQISNEDSAIALVTINFSSSVCGGRKREILLKPATARFQEPGFRVMASCRTLWPWIGTVILAGGKVWMAPSIAGRQRLVPFV